jgi:TRAP-type C4-dicarboxylate transport system permease small subunit
VKLHPKIQLILRILLWVVSLGLFASGAITGWNYLQDHRAPKETVTATIVRQPAKSDSYSLSYTFEGKTFTEKPIGKLVSDYGKLGDKVKVYVNTNTPSRVFLTETPTGELFHTALLLGWALVLFTILWSEGRLLKILKIEIKKENIN